MEYSQPLRLKALCLPRSHSFSVAPTGIDAWCWASLVRWLPGVSGGWLRRPGLSDDAKDGRCANPPFSQLRPGLVLKVQRPHFAHLQTRNRPWLRKVPSAPGHGHHGVAPRQLAPFRAAGAQRVTEGACAVQFHPETVNLLMQLPGLSLPQSPQPALWPLTAKGKWWSPHVFPCSLPLGVAGETRCLVLSQDRPSWSVECFLLAVTHPQVH